MSEVIAEYDQEMDWFELTTEVCTVILNPDEMKALVETALYAIARRMELTKKATL